MAESQRLIGFRFSTFNGISFDASVNPFEIDSLALFHLNQIIHVKTDKPTKGFHSMDTVWISGTLKTLRSDSYMGASGYRMDAVVVERYVEPK